MPTETGTESEPLAVVPAGWIAKPEAIKLTGRSRKGFENIVKAEAIEAQFVKHRRSRPTPIYKRADIQRLKKPPSVTASQVSALAVHGHQEIAPTYKRLAAPAIAPPAVSIDRMHLVTAKQAHQLGYPLELLREWKNSPNPPGVRYSKAGFRFSVPALAERMKAIG